MERQTKINKILLLKNDKNITKKPMMPQCCDSWIEQKTQANKKLSDEDT